MNLVPRRTFVALVMLATAATAGRTAPATTPPAPWLPDRGDGTYQNPVLFADYSDPDVVRVGDDYWLISSSFSHVPGLPILHSRDLVNWELVNHAVAALDYPDGTGKSLAGHYATTQHGGGIWAPAIRYHSGKYYIFFPDPDYGLYVTTATDPRQPWTPPVLVKAGRGLIDPCPLWDDDGKVYLVHAWAASRAGRNNQLTVNELSADATRVLDGEGTVVIDENKSGRGFRTLEGPKFYKHASEYWIFAPVGGVPQGTQIAYRAKNIRGPYAARTVLAQGSTETNGPHQGGWVDTPQGENWFLHFQDRGPFGRVVHLEPMTWGDDGWPRMGTAVKTGAECGEPVLTYAIPKAARAAASVPVAPAMSDHFDTPVLGQQWQWPANAQPTWYSLTAHSGYLRLSAVSNASGSLYDAPNVLLQKFVGPAFTATAVLDATALRENESAGLVVFGYAVGWIGVARDKDGLHLVQAADTSHGPQANRAAPAKSTSTSRPQHSPRVYLRISVDPAATCTFAFSEDGKHFTVFQTDTPFHATVDRWVGAKFGLFATGAPGTTNPGFADFDWIQVSR